MMNKNDKIADSPATMADGEKNYFSHFLVSEINGDLRQK